MHRKIPIKYINYFFCCLIGIEIIAIAVGSDIDLNALRKFVKSSEDIIISLSGSLDDMNTVNAAVERTCHFVGKGTH